MTAMTEQCPDAWAPTHYERCSLDAGHTEPHSAYAADGRRGGWQPTHHPEENLMTEQTKTPAAAEAPGARWLALANETTDPLNCIAMALTGILELGVRHGEQEQAEDDQRALLDQLDRELGEKAQIIDGVLEALGKSTSQVSKNVRAVIEGTPPAPADEPTPAPDAQPVRDADIAEWRAYGRSQGLPDVDELNRSQIRSLLGIPNA